MTLVYSLFPRVVPVGGGRFELLARRGAGFEVVAAGCMVAVIAAARLLEVPVASLSPLSLTQSKEVTS